MRVLLRALGVAVLGAAVGAGMTGCSASGEAEAASDGSGAGWHAVPVSPSDPAVEIVESLNRTRAIVGEVRSGMQGAAEREVAPAADSASKSAREAAMERRMDELSMRRAVDTLARSADRVEWMLRNYRAAQAGGQDTDVLFERMVTVTLTLDQEAGHVEEMWAEWRKRYGGSESEED